MGESLVLKNVRPWGGAKVDVLVEDGVFTRIAPGIAGPRPDTTVEEGENALLLPGLVEGHTHMDKTLLGLNWNPHRAGPTVLDRIENEKLVRRRLRPDPATQASRQIRLACGKGTTHIRTHVDVDPELGLTHLEGVLSAREHHRDVMDVQIVAFPQSGVLRIPGTAELLEAAIDAGADVLGGLDPAGIDRDPVAQLNILFAIAERKGVGIDLHLHDPGELGAFEVELIVERAIVHGMQGKVSISHAFCLGMVGDMHLRRLAAALHEAGISIMTHGPGASAFPPILTLHDAGITLFSGSDGIRDAWSPYGNADMLERAMILGYRSNFRTDESLGIALDMVTNAGARALGISRYGLCEGCIADCTMVAASTPGHAVVERPPRRLVLKNGRIVARDGYSVHPALQED